MAEKKVYNFGEKKEEWHSGKGKSLPVYQSPKYGQSKKKAIELIESGKYGLDEGDFWILMNATKSGKMMYTGLIISHNGCLKINSELDPKMRFSPSSVSFVKDEGDKVKVMQYINEEQGVYEFGEISPKNCMNDYPYAMVLKRLMDRVILKNSKVGFFGIYSDSESEDFKEKPEPKEEKTEKQIVEEEWQNSKEGKEWLTDNFKDIKEKIEACEDLEELGSVWKTNQVNISRFKRYAKNQFDLLTDTKEEMKKAFEIANELEAPQ